MDDRNFSATRNQSGQALIEYILVLIVVVSVLLSLAIRVMPSINGYLSVIAGDYISCLLEQGEVPSFGGSSTTSTADSCDSKLSVASTKLASSGAGAAGSSSNSSASGKSSGSDNSSSNAAAGKNGDGKSSGGGGGYSGGTGVSVNGRLGGLQNSKSVGALDGGKNDDDKVIKIGQNKSSGFMRTRSSSTTAASSEGRYIGGAIPLTDAQKKQIEGKTEGKGRGITSIAEEMAPKVKRTLVKPPPPKASAPKDDEPMGFGNFLRILIIIIIVLLLIFLIGGQAFSTSKGWEK